MTRVREWLEGLALGQFADAFEAEQIELRALPRLTESDLKDMGLPIGPRRIVLQAARELDGDPGATLRIEVASVAEPFSVAQPREAQRRQITVMFCDLVGSTALSERLDPEDLRSLLQAYQQTCGVVIERYAGHIAQYLGDGLMVYFGWPVAHEDDAERAVRAGLEVIEAVKKVAAPDPLQVRVGIATGAVVVGETGAGDASVPKLAVGETPNLAARVQGMAGPDQILIADSTHRLTGGAFDYADLGKQTLKGILDPVRTWRIEALARTQGRFEAARGLRLTPHIGREEEVGMVLRRWEQACDGEGQVVAVCGEPGIGKSRILHELQSRLSDTPHRTMRYQCSPYHTNAPLHPFTEQLERMAGWDRDDAPQAKCDKLEAVIAAAGRQAAALMPLLAPVLSLATGSRYPALNLSAQKQKEQTLSALCELALGAAGEQPVLILFEDVHWIDPTSQGALDLLVAATARHRVLMVVTYRPEYNPPWSGFGHIMSLTLTRLGRRQAAAMVERVTGGVPLPQEVLGLIVAKTDGVPLFVEELTKTVIESGLVTRTNGAYALTGPVTDFAIPSTLHDSLMARLDRLAPAREVAQIGACIGREFSHALLSAISPMTDNAFNDALQQLIASELIYAVGTPPEANYTFKHALVQDAAYESLLRGRRRELHFAIAQNLAKMQGTEPALLASHYTKAEMPELAVPKWLEAGQKALAATHYSESIAHAQAGLLLLDGLKSPRDRSVLEISLHTCLAFNYVATRGYGAYEAGASFRRSEELLPEIDDDRVALPVLLGIGIFHWIRADFPLSVKYFQNLLSRAERGGDDLMAFAARAEIATIQLWIGTPVAGRPLIRQVLDDYDPAKHGILTSLAGQDYAVLTAALAAKAENYLGYFDSSRKMAERGIAIAREIKHPFSIGMALCLASSVAIERGEIAATFALAQECIDICDEQGLPYYADWARATRGLAAAFDGRPEAGVIEIGRAMDAMEGLGSQQSRPMLGIYWAEAMLLAGRPEEVYETMRQHLDLIEQYGEFGFLSSTRLMMGRALLDYPDPDMAEAEAELHRCLDCAREQGGKMIELRAATSLARLWQTQGKTQKANDLLKPVYDWFTEGFDTPDLREAKALLEAMP